MSRQMRVLDVIASSSAQARTYLVQPDKRDVPASAMAHPCSAFVTVESLWMGPRSVSMLPKVPPGVEPIMCGWRDKPKSGQGFERLVAAPAVDYVTWRAAAGRCWVGRLEKYRFPRWSGSYGLDGLATE